MALVSRLLSRLPLQPSNDIEFSGERKRVRYNEGLGALFDGSIEASG